ncbi:MAG: hypothetical protein ACLFRP_06175 [Puniceicoccaceae bacterium]
MVIQTKRNTPALACDIVSEASRWMKSQLIGAGVGYQYGACDGRTHSSFSSFTIFRETAERKLLFRLKIAEIAGDPYAFIEAHPVGKPTEILFPFFGEIGSDEGKNRILNYVADFLLSTEKSEE